MKTLKLNSLLFSLLAIIAVCITSCNKDTSLDSTPVEAQNDSRDSFLLPHGYDNDDESAIQYIENATALEKEKMKENYEVFQFLVSIERYEDIAATLEYSENISDVNLSDFLTAEELSQQANFVAPISDRGCTWLTYCVVRCCSGHPTQGVCTYSIGCS